MLVHADRRCIEEICSASIGFCISPVQERLLSSLHTSIRAVGANTMVIVAELLIPKLLFCKSSTSPKTFSLALC